MRTYLKLSLLLAISTTAQAQVSYSVSPAKAVNVTAPYNETTVSDIYQANTGNSKIVLKWERVSVNLPVGWIASICDFGACYGSIPSMSTMDSIPVGGKGLLGLNLDPGTIAGAGVVKVYLYQDGYYSNGDTITWNITSSAVGIEEISVTDGIVIYPNPAKNYLNINFKKSGFQTSFAYLIDALGREVFNISLTEQNNSIDVSFLNTGFYNLVIQTGEKKLVKRIIKTE